MRKQTPKRKPNSADTLLEKGEVELTEEQLGNVSGGTSNIVSQVKDSHDRYANL